MVSKIRLATYSPTCYRAAAFELVMELQAMRAMVEIGIDALNRFDAAG